MPNPVAAPALAAVALALAAGCTICPDPFDYSGPVPDGSAPQNDFRARANGIANPGSHPVPWPPVVRAVPRSGDESREITVVAETVVREAGDEGAVDEEAVDGAVVDHPDAAGPDAAPAVVPPAVSTPATVETFDDAEAADDESGPPAPQPPVPLEASIDEILPPPAAVRQEAAPRLRESPGWRPRG